MLRVYFDSCVYNRPFDDYRRDERIFLEAMAFYVVLHLVENGHVEIIGSDALLYENALIADAERKKRVRIYLERASGFIELSESNTERARELVNLGFKSLDALHIAMAEQAFAEYFVTCDNGIIKKGRAAQDELKIKVRSILDFVGEVVYAEDIKGN